MKKTLLTLAVVGLTASAFSQGTLNILNTLGTTFRSQIYGQQAGAGHEGDSLSGNSTIGVPAGTTAYTGPLLAGAGYTFAVYAGADAGSMSLLWSGPFRTGGAAGLIQPQLAFTVPGVGPGLVAQLQVRAWDNGAGTLNTYEAAIIKGQTGVFASQPLGGGVLIAPDMTGWQSFNIYAVPEPSTIVLAGLGAASVLLFRRRK